MAKTKWMFHCSKINAKRFTLEKNTHHVSPLTTKSTLQHSIWLCHAIANPQSFTKTNIHFPELVCHNGVARQEFSESCQSTFQLYFAINV
mmetsp:Transcript_26234/g.38393  ORF Transcript_26234/g.38393 Transcript_26234/m.38393 type:complete len:90 (-) Transcript_26234:2517-2786(-)